MRKTLLDTNAEHAAVQEVAVSATIELALQSRDAHTEVNALRGLLMEVKLNAVSVHNLNLPVQYLTIARCQ